LFLCIGFFSSSIDNWRQKQYPFTRDEWGVWRLTIPPLADGSPAIKHGQIIKVEFKAIYISRIYFVFLLLL
jgi:hypothetical protein